jgi:hypothetical protein
MQQEAAWRQLPRLTWSQQNNLQRLLKLATPRKQSKEMIMAMARKGTLMAPAGLLLTAWAGHFRCLDFPLDSIRCR